MGGFCTLRILDSLIHTLLQLVLPLTLIGTHIYLTIRLRLPQRQIPQGIRQTLRGGFPALAVQLSAALGVGNIVGVALAIACGGPGAVFWCWLSGAFGVATTYAEACMTLECRRDAGSGPWSAMRRGMGMFYAAAVAAGGLFIGSMIPANAIAAAVSLPKPAAACILGLLTGITALGGSVWLQRTCERLLPAAAGLYLLACLGILFVCRDSVPWAIRTIHSGAFSLKGAAGGALGSAPMLAAIRYGAARGLFSNEAGLGTAGIAAAALPEGDPAAQAAVSATATFWDTVVFCGVTGLAFVAAIPRLPGIPRDGMAFCTAVFSLLPGGAAVLRLTVLLLGLACIFGWCCIGTRAFSHACPGTPARVYAVFWTLSAVFGVLCSAEGIWRLSDLLNAAAICPMLYTLRRYYAKNRAPSTIDLTERI